MVRRFARREASTQSVRCAGRYRATPCYGVFLQSKGLPIFSRKSDYGLRALIYLAEHREQGPITLNEIAEELDIPKAFLSKILQQLCHNSIVKSLKGPSGGFVLAREPQQLTMGEIVKEIDGPLNVFECFSSSHDPCTHHGNCKILAVFDNVGREVERVLGSVKLSDMLSEACAKQGCAGAATCKP
ncbi:MAG: Rrf2 family transcriptional regulator [Planctomycetaceae bacterium]|nr:Rrf2 family transcriptional regulator [Planctomycetaceae bacterium]